MPIYKDHHGFTVSYKYDAAGNLSEITYPGNKVVSYTYDDLNRLESVTIKWLGTGLPPTIVIMMMRAG